jgi:hypothetical protein
VHLVTEGDAARDGVGLGGVEPIHHIRNWTLIDVTASGSCERIVSISCPQHVAIICCSVFGSIPITEHGNFRHSIRRYRDLIRNTFDHGLSTARSEVTDTSCDH